MIVFEYGKAKGVTTAMYNDFEHIFLWRLDGTAKYCNRMTPNYSFNQSYIS